MRVEKGPALVISGVELGVNDQVGLGLIGFTGLFWAESGFRLESLGLLCCVQKEAWAGDCTDRPPLWAFCFAGKCCLRSRKLLRDISWRVHCGMFLDP